MRVREDERALPSEEREKKSQGNTSTSTDDFPRRKPGNRKKNGTTRTSEVTQAGKLVHLAPTCKSRWAVCWASARARC